MTFQIFRLLPALLLVVSTLFAQVFGPGQASPQLPQFAVGQRMEMFLKNGAKPLVGFACFTPVSSASCTALWPHIDDSKRDYAAWKWATRLCNEGSKSSRRAGASCALRINTNDLGFVGGVLLVIPTFDGDKELNAIWVAMARDAGASEDALRSQIEVFATSGRW